MVRAVLCIEKYNRIMSSLVNKILKEAEIAVMNIFDKAIPNRYGFILSDNVRYPNMEDKMDIINLLEDYRLKSGEGLPVQILNPNIFTATQDTVNAENIRNIAANYDEIDKLPFAVKFNNTYYLVDGHHRVSVAIITKQEMIEVRVYDMDQSKEIIVLGEHRSYKFDQKLPERYSFLYRDNTKFNKPEYKWACIDVLEKYRRNRNTLKTVELNAQMFVSVNGSTDSAKIPFVIRYFNTYYILDGMKKPQPNIYQGPELVKVKLLDLDTLKIGMDRQTSYHN